MPLGSLPVPLHHSGPAARSSPPAAPRVRPQPAARPLPAGGGGGARGGAGAGGGRGAGGGGAEAAGAPGIRRHLPGPALAAANFGRESPSEPPISQPSAAGEGSAGSRPPLPSRCRRGLSAARGPRSRGRCVPKRSPADAAGGAGPRARRGHPLTCRRRPGTRRRGDAGRRRPRPATGQGGGGGGEGGRGGRRPAAGRRGSAGRSRPVHGERRRRGSPRSGSLERGSASRRPSSAAPHASRPSDGRRSALLRRRGRVYRGVSSGARAAVGRGPSAPLGPGSEGRGKGPGAAAMGERRAGPGRPLLSDATGGTGKAGVPR